MAKEKMNVKIVRMMSGEEILCDLVKETAKELVMKQPCIIVPSGGNNLGIAPWMPYAVHEDDCMVVPEKVVGFVCTPHEELAKEYKRVHSDTPEILVPNKEVVGIIGADDPKASAFKTT